MRYYLHQSRKAVWSLRFALIAFLLFSVTFALHHLGNMPTPLAMKLSGVAIGAAIIAALIGFVALGNIWQEGFTGAGKAVAGIFTSALILAVPLWSMPNLLTLPRLYEVSTDLQSPPPFEKLAELRKGPGVNSATYKGSAPALQSEAYPDIRPLSLDRPTGDAYSAVREAVKNLNWQIVAETPPAEGQNGFIEATDRSTIFGFADDVAIRVSAIGNGARIDARASARYGEHDLGRNAERVRELFSEVKTRLAAIDQNEAMQQAIAMRELRLKKALEEKERERVQAEREERRQRERAAALSRERQISDSGTEALDGSQPLRARSGSRAPDARAQSRKQQRTTRTRALRKFWEQLNR